MRRKNRALTLIELLVALIISSLIIGAAYSSWLAASAGWNKSRSRGLSYQYGRTALAMLERHIESALAPNDESVIIFEGESALIEGTELAADSIRLTGTGHPVRPGRPFPADMSEVEFYLDISEQTGEPSLMMRHRTVPSDDPEYKGIEEELAPRVVSFNVQYYDGIEFIDDWVLDELPQAVQLSLILYDFENEESPIRFQKLISLRNR